MTITLPLLVLLAALAAAWWLRRAWRACAACILFLSEFHHPNLVDFNDQ